MLKKMDRGFEGDFLLRNLSRENTKPSRRNSNFSKKNAQIPPAEGPNRQKESQRRILSSDFAASEAYCMYTRAREGGRRSEGFRGGREERLWGRRGGGEGSEGFRGGREERLWGRRGREGSQQEGDKDVDERGSAVAYQGALGLLNGSVTGLHM